MRVVQSCDGSVAQPNVRMKELSPGEVGIGMVTGLSFLRIEGDAVVIRTGARGHLEAYVKRAPKATVVIQGCKCQE